MKSTRWMVVVLLAVVCAMGWMLYLGGSVSESKAREETVAEARESRGQKLYQLAANAYYKALETKVDVLLYGELLDTLEEYYAEEKSNAARKELIAAYDAAVFAFPDHTEFWERFVQMYLNDGDYSAAGTVLNKATAAKISSEELDTLRKTVFYAYEVDYHSFTNISLSAVAGQYLAQDADRWGIVDAWGAQVLPFGYTLISAPNEDKLTLVFTADGEVRLLDEEGVMQARFTAAVAEMGTYGDGLIPVRLEGREDWCYLDKTGAEQFGGFRTAGSFRSGTAAVQMADGKWCLIGTDGQQSSSNTWDQVLLTEDGSYIHGNRVLLKTDGRWQLYSKSGSAVEGFACDEIDAGHGEAIAFCSGGKWGFVSLDGTVIIEPTYENARSFSSGVGAVCKDGLWGFVDETGELVVDCVFADAGYFNEDGTCVVRLPDTQEYQLIKWCAKR